MNDVSTIQKSLQEQLIKAIESHADLDEITDILDRGGIANDVSVIQAVEEHADKAGKDWSMALFAIPQIAEAWRLREIADQAAYDLVESLEQNDLDGVKAALQEMVAAGDDANLDIGDGSMLAIAVQNQCDLNILRMLMDVGKADPTGFSRDAVEALGDVENSSWKRAIQTLFRNAGVKLPM
jgi:hypothetical protein